MHNLALLSLTGPLVLVGAGNYAVMQQRGGSAVYRAVTLATLAALLVAAVSLLAGLISGPLQSQALGVGGYGFSVRLDTLSGVMVCLVAFIGVVVSRYSFNYLAGDPRQGRFLGWLCYTVAAVMTLVVSGNLLQLLGAWVATSLCLHQLLVFYPERRGAQVAARKKFILARTGDVMLGSAVVLLIGVFGTPDIAEIQSRLDSGDVADIRLSLAGFLIVAAAMLKSAQFPTHGWLTEVMETPTPVSALLHAGIINAGGFLVIRLADVVIQAPVAMHLLALVGGFTALFGGVVMLTQPSVKVSLAWSTVAQMGFMMLQIGLGAFSVACLHLVAHSLYKAHAFLSSGSVIEISRASWVPAARKHIHLAEILVAASGASLLYAGGMFMLGAATTSHVVELGLGSILVMGLTHLILQSSEGQSVEHSLVRTILLAGGVALGFVALHAGAKSLFADTVPAVAATGMSYAVLAVAMASFLLVIALQILAPVWMKSPRWLPAYIHLSNGLYVNALFDRLVGADRIKPQPQN